ncbi:hypothetical protein ABN228_01990 [Providencia rettgeri]|uniref:hypothetical protein n=1 Tax=Providencia rettgeri TaxID=587 RepID=UPI000ED379F5|nr:hypothetical protein [Providencia sp.]
MKKLAALCGLLLLSAGAQAIPNVWSSSFAQGFTEYSIANNNGYRIIIACNSFVEPDDYDEAIDHGFHVYKDDQSIEGNIEFLIDGSPFFVPDGTKYRVAANAWNDLMTELAKSTKFEIYIDGKSGGEFTPNKKNMAKEIPDGFCGAMF